METIAGHNKTILTQIEEALKRRSEFMDEIDTTLEDVTRVETEELVITPPTQGNLPQQVDISTAHGVSNSKVRLPKLHLPSFDGKFKE